MSDGVKIVQDIRYVVKEKRCDDTLCMIMME